MLNKIDLKIVVLLRPISTKYQLECSTEKLFREGFCIYRCAADVRWICASAARLFNIVSNYRKNHPRKHEY